LHPPLADSPLDGFDPPLAHVGRERVERGRRQNHSRRHDESPPGEMPRDGGGCWTAHDEQQRPNRADRHRETPRALTTARDHALESTCLIAGQMPRAVLGQRLGGKRLDAIGHRLIVGQTLGGDNGRTFPGQVPGVDTTI
jgi:hypothetical protein